MSENENTEEITETPAEDEAPVAAAVDESKGNKMVCIACERRRKGGKPYKHGHAPFCEKSIYYGLTAEQISTLKEERSNKLKDTKENVLRRMGLSAKDTELKFPAISSTYDEVCGVPANLSAKHLSALVDANTQNSSKAPLAVTVILRYLQALAPNLKKGTNQVIQHEENIKKLDFFRGVFPRGCISFTVPKEDPSARPNAEYRIAEGCTLLLVRWEFQTDEQLPCHFCKKGSLIPKKLSFTRTSVKPILDIDGKLSWSIASMYKCSNCEITMHATDPDLILSLPQWMQNAYPVTHNWINRVKIFQIGRRLATLMEAMFIGENYDGHFISYFLRKIYDIQYKRDHQLLREASLEYAGEDISEKEWSFERWTGDFTFPQGDTLREAFEFSRQVEKGSPNIPETSVGYIPINRPPLPHSPNQKPRPTLGIGGKRDIPPVGPGAVNPETPSKRVREGDRRPPKMAIHPNASPLPPVPLPHLPRHYPLPGRPANPNISPNAALSPHTPTAYHQWPQPYGPGPQFPYSPHTRFPPPYFPHGTPPNIPVRQPLPQVVAPAAQKPEKECSPRKEK